MDVFPIDRDLLRTYLDNWHHTACVLDFHLDTSLLRVDPGAEDMPHEDRTKLCVWLRENTPADIIEVIFEFGRPEPYTVVALSDNYSGVINILACVAHPGPTNTHAFAAVTACILERLMI